jgi:hypothetical protein
MARKSLFSLTITSSPEPIGPEALGRLQLAFLVIEASFRDEIPELLEKTAPVDLDAYAYVGIAESGASCNRRLALPVTLTALTARYRHGQAPSFSCTVSSSGAIPSPAYPDASHIF